MWMTARVVWQFEFDGSAGEHHESKGGFGAVEAVGASDEQPDLGVEAFVTPVGQPAVDGGVDPGAVLADGARGFDELRDTATLSARTPPIEQLSDGGWVEVTGEHLPQGFFEKVGTPEYSTGAFHLPQSRGLLVGEIWRGLQQRPPRALEGLGDALVGQRRGALPHVPAHRLERVCDELDDMEWVKADHRGRRAFPHGPWRRPGPCPSTPPRWIRPPRAAPPQKGLWGWGSLRGRRAAHL